MRQGTVVTRAGGEDGQNLMEEVYRDMVSQDELSKLDSQPNPFNFSERVSQTNRFSHKVSQKFPHLFKPL